ncbi:hypothetical protein [Bacillus sp. Au-Bac7]|uniref:hypothetical protein n=1 Tax=Bacillus sp. Au-Bac7 TaxID=2906458 RepID=UPI001E4C96AD|nr:hypothetical protein [Bacillus sp. Au-Bac7]MCE4050978.1 hypothetical protein [Bacillus sp. Au-Bac7]
MSEDLKSLRRSLNSTVLKHGKMSITDKERLYQTVIYHKDSKKRFSFAPVLSIAAIACFALFIGSFVFKQMENTENQQNQLALINNQEENEEKTNSKREEQKGNNSNLASFLYELNLRLSDAATRTPLGKDYATEVGKFAENLSGEYTSKEKETTIADKLMEIGSLGKSLQNADNDEKRMEDIVELERVVNQLIVIAEAHGIIDERNNIIEKTEFENLESWLSSLKESIHADSYEPYSDRRQYENHIGNAAKAYAKHFAALEKNTSVKEQLEEIAEISNQIEKEKEDEKRTTLLNKLDGMVEQLLVD